jgi:uncharacterized protein
MVSPLAQDRIRRSSSAMACPGNEKFLDLAQAVRRAGWNAVTFNYRGSWGSPKAFRFSHNLEDADAVLAYLRDPANAARLGIDTQRIAMVGHSMGGWVVVHTAAHDRGLIGAINCLRRGRGQTGRVAQRSPCRVDGGQHGTAGGRHRREYGG